MDKSCNAWLLSMPLAQRNTKCDNCIIATMIILQYLACIFDLIAICVQDETFRVSYTFCSQVSQDSVLLIWLLMVDIDICRYLGPHRRSSLVYSMCMYAGASCRSASVSGNVALSFILMICVGAAQVSARWAWWVTSGERYSASNPGRKNYTLGWPMLISGSLLSC